MFHEVFQCLQYDQYQHRKLAGYIERETLEKVCGSLRERAMKKEILGVINKRAAGII